MGADVYLEKAYDKKYADHKETLDSFPKANSDVELTEVQRKHMSDIYDDLYKQGDVYFRDSYNSGSVLWAMNLSWWDDILPMCDDEGYLDADGIRKFLDMVEDAPLHVSQGFQEHMPSEWTYDDALEYLQEEQNLLISFLKKALDTNDRLSCSL
tara:strand:+ start:38 stop:499 length:462 start_codon:yes stop_codon:yes gene_type:complete